MPPINDVSSLSDEQLSDILKEYGVDVGPINVATRRTYERYLLKLQSGKPAPPSPHEPVDDDDEDEDTEVILKQPAFQQESVPSQPRQRNIQESHIPTPRGDSLSRPPLSSARKMTSAPFTPSARPSQPSTSQQVKSSNGSIPVWVKLTALLVVLVLAYLIYTNMEPNAVSNIPSIPNKMQV